MTKQHAVCAKMQEQQRFIEGQQVEIEQQRHQLDIQFKRMAQIQAQVDRIHAALQRVTPMPSPKASITETISASSGTAARVQLVPSVDRPRQATTGLTEHANTAADWALSRSRTAR